MDDIDCLYGTTNGTLCSSLDDQLYVGKESAGNKNSYESSDFKYVGDDDKDHDMELHAKMFEDNVVIEEDEVVYGDSANLFGQDKEMGIRDFDDDLYTPKGYDDKVLNYGEF